MLGEGRGRIPAHSGRGHDIIPGDEVHFVVRKRQADFEPKAMVHVAVARVALHYRGVDRVLVVIGAIHIVLIVDHAALAHWGVVPGLIRAEVISLDHCVPSWVVLIVIFFVISVNIIKLNVIVDGGGGWVWTAGCVLMRIVLEVVAVVGVMAVKALTGLQAVYLSGDAVYALGPRQRGFTHRLRAGDQLVAWSDPCASRLTPRRERLRSIIVRLWLRLGLLLLVVGVHYLFFHSQISITCISIFFSPACLIKSEILR